MQDYDDEMIEVLLKLNEDKDRCVMIGRNALNFLCKKNGYAASFHTNDYDILCPDIEMANECARILELNGFKRELATFTGKYGEIDVVIASKDIPEGELQGYYNIPSLNTMWEKRNNVDGVLIPSLEDIIINKLEYARENEGKDAETIELFFQIYPDKISSVLNRIKDYKEESKDSMLISLYESVSSIPELKKRVERELINNIQRANEEGFCR